MPAGLGDFGRDKDRDNNGVTLPALAGPQSASSLGHAWLPPANAPQPCWARQHGSSLGGTRSGRAGSLEGQAASVPADPARRTNRDAALWITGSDELDILMWFVCRGFYFVPDPDRI
jgi:hypothetical protein